MTMQILTRMQWLLNDILCIDIEFPCLSLLREGTEKGFWSLVRITEQDQELVSKESKKEEKNHSPPHLCSH